MLDITLGSTIQKGNEKNSKMLEVVEVTEQPRRDNRKGLIYEEAGIGKVYKIVR